MAYLAATRYGLTRIEPTGAQQAAGWRQVWHHPGGLLARRRPIVGCSVLSDGYEIMTARASAASSLACAGRLAASSATAAGR
jgi:hypothetical protein